MTLCVLFVFVHPLRCVKWLIKELSIYLSILCQMIGLICMLPNDYYLNNLHDIEPERVLCWDH